jgi:hypothetical protein
LADKAMKARSIAVSILGTKERNFAVGQLGYRCKIWRPIFSSHDDRGAVRSFLLAQRFALSRVLFAAN